MVTGMALDYNRSNVPEKNVHLSGRHIQQSSEIC